MKKGFFAFMALLLMSAACERITPDEGVRLDKKLATELKKAQETISIDGRMLVLTANLWRDFMPKIGEADNSMRAAVKVVCSNKVPLSESLKPVRLMVVKEDSVWVANIENSERPEQLIIQINAKGGPKWNVGNSVDVIVELDDEGRTYYLRKSGVSIEATY